MAEFQEVARQFKRLCDSQKFCDDCIMHENRGINTCYRFMMEEPMKAEEVVMEWAAEHSRVTNRMILHEVFGKDIFESYKPILDAWLDSEYKGGQDE